MFVPEFAAQIPGRRRLGAGARAKPARKGAPVPNYEIRDFDADGARVMVRIATAATRAEAEEQARRRLDAFATYELGEASRSGRPR